MRLLDYRLSISHLVVVILLKIPQLFSVYMMKVHILYTIYKCTDHSAHKKIVDVRISLLPLLDKFTIRFDFGYLNHFHGRKPPNHSCFSSINVLTRELLES